MDQLGCRIGSHDSIAKMAIASAATVMVSTAMDRSGARRYMSAGFELHGSGPSIGGRRWDLTTHAPTALSRGWATPLGPRLAATEDGTQVAFPIPGAGCAAKAGCSIDHQHVAAPNADSTLAEAQKPNAAFAGFAA